MNIRQATSADGAAIAELWNPFILGGDVTFNSIEKTAEGLARDIADKQASSPFCWRSLVAGWPDLPPMASSAPRTVIGAQWNTRSFWPQTFTGADSGVH